MKSKEWVLTMEFAEWMSILCRFAVEADGEGQVFYADWERDLQSGEMSDEA